MNNQARNDLIVEKLHEGMSLSDLQKLLAQEYQIRMTYLELRLLADELAVNWKKLDKPKTAENKPENGHVDTVAENNQQYEYQKVAGEEDDDDDFADDDEDDNESLLPEDDFDDDIDDSDEDGDGATKVLIDPQPRPGTMLSGKVKFASGLRAGWFMDRRGQLSLDLPEDAEQPSQEDILGFQQELQATMQKLDAELRQAANDGRTKVTINPVVPPGVRVGGDVQFASGAKGGWYIDNAGRMGFTPDEDSSKPNQEDISLFQIVLQDELRKHGYGG